MEEFIGKTIEFMVLDCKQEKVKKVDVYVNRCSHIQTGTEFYAVSVNKLEVSELNPHKMVLGQVKEPIGKATYSILSEEEAKERSVKAQKAIMDELNNPSVKSKKEEEFEALQIFSDSDRRLMHLNGIIPAGTPDYQIAFFFRIAKHRGLNPMTKEIYLIPRETWTKDNGKQIVYNIVVAIDGMRKKVHDSNEYVGLTMRYDGLSVSEWVKEARTIYIEALREADEEAARINPTDTKTSKAIKARPRKAVVPFLIEATVERLVQGSPRKFTRTILSHEFQSDSNPMYNSMPFAMLQKVAEAHALRAAFSDVLGDSYVEEEMVNEAANYATAIPAPQAIALPLHEALKALDACTTMSDLNALAPKVAGLDDDFMQQMQRKLDEIKAQEQAQPQGKTQAVDH